MLVLGAAGGRKQIVVEFDYHLRIRQNLFQSTQQRMRLADLAVAVEAHPAAHTVVGQDAAQLLGFGCQQVAVLLTNDLHDVPAGGDGGFHAGARRLVQLQRAVH